jgi:hypothetical protein
MVVGARSSSDTLARVTQVERLTSATASGASWNPTYAVWDVPVSANAATVAFDPKGAAISAPIFHFTNFTGTQPGTVSIDGVTQQADVGYFATLDPTTQSLWVTLNGTVSAPISVQVR